MTEGDSGIMVTQHFVWQGQARSEESFLAKRTLRLAIKRPFFGGSSVTVERTFALTVRLAAKMQPGRLYLQKTGTALSAGKLAVSK